MEMLKHGDTPNKDACKVERERERDTLAKTNMTMDIYLLKMYFLFENGFGGVIQLTHFSDTHNSHLLRRFSLGLSLSHIPGGY